jgi:hypothetical protein
MKQLSPDKEKCSNVGTISEGLKLQWERIQQWATSFVSGPRWIWKVLLLCIAFSILCGGSVDFYNLEHGYYQGYFQKIEHPLADLSKIYEAGSHEAKLNYRLTIPVLLHPLGLNAEQALHWVLPAVSIIGVCLVILFTCLVTFQYTEDRVVSLFAALNVSATYIGSFGFILCYDAITMAQVILAMAPRIPWLCRMLLAFSASFTDERGFMAAGLIVLGNTLLPLGKESGPLINRQSFAILSGLAGYWVVRLILAHWFALPGPIKGVGPGSFVLHIKHWHAGIWFALEGGWLLVTLSLFALWKNGRRLRSWLFVLSLALPLGLSFANGDLVRTTCYLLPLGIRAVVVIFHNERREAVRFFAFFAFLISAICGSYNVYMNEITWFMPLPVQLIEQGMKDLYVVFRIRVFGEMP